METQPNKTEKNLLSKKQRLFIPIFLRCKNVKTAVELAGIDRSTWWRWNQEPAFKAALEDERNRLIADAMDTLSLNLGGAHDRIVELMASRDDSCALRAAVALAEIRLKAVSMTEIQDRLAALEQSVQDKK